MSCPAAPKSETPREIFYLPRNGYAGNQPAVWLDDWRRMRRRAEEAERCESLAQTEIKGHMRVVDELKEDIARLQQRLTRFNEERERQTTRADEAQSRIAELEKVLRDLLAANPRYNASAELDTAIDAALKSRA